MIKNKCMLCEEFATMTGEYCLACQIQNTMWNTNHSTLQLQHQNVFQHSSPLPNQEASSHILSGLVFENMNTEIAHLQNTTSNCTSCEEGQTVFHSIPESTMSSSQWPKNNFNPDTDLYLFGHSPTSPLFQNFQTPVKDPWHHLFETQFKYFESNVGWRMGATQFVSFFPPCVVLGHQNNQQEVYYLDEFVSTFVQKYPKGLGGVAYAKRQGSLWNKDDILTVDESGLLFRWRIVESPLGIGPGQQQLSRTLIRDIRTFQINGIPSQKYVKGTSVYGRIIQGIISGLAFDPYGQLYVSEIFTNTSNTTGTIYQIQVVNQGLYAKAFLEIAPGISFNPPVWNGQFAFAPDGTLYLSSGAGTKLGKIYKTDVKAPTMNIGSSPIVFFRYGIIFEETPRQSPSQPPTTISPAILGFSFASDISLYNKGESIVLYATDETELWGARVNTDFVPWNPTTIQKQPTLRFFKHHQLQTLQMTDIDASGILTENFSPPPTFPPVHVINKSLSLSYDLCLLIQNGDVFFSGIMGSKQASVFTKIPELQGFNMKSVAALQGHNPHQGDNLALDSQGRVYSWGPTGTNATNRWKPNPVSFPAGEIIKDIDTGYQYSLALSEQGNLYFWGSDERGLMGTGTFEPGSSGPVKIPLPGQVQTMSAGHSAILAVVYDEIEQKLIVYGWGEKRPLGLDPNVYSPRQRNYITIPQKILLANGSSLSSITQVAVSGSGSLALNKTTNTVYFFGDEFRHDGNSGYVGNPIPVSGLNAKIESIYASRSDFFALSDENTGGILYSWGTNSSQAIIDSSQGKASSNLPVTSIARGVKFVTATTFGLMYLKQDGTICVAGDNGWFGAPKPPASRLGQGPNAPDLIPQFKCGVLFAP